MAITFVGAGALAVNTSGSISPSLPAGWAAGDFAVLFVAGNTNDGVSPGVPSGWSARTSFQHEVGARDLRFITNYRVLQLGDTAPSLTIPAGMEGGAAGGMYAFIAAWRGVDPSTPFDVADVTLGDDATGAGLWTPTGITTVTDGAVVVSAFATNDDTDASLNTANGFTLQTTLTSAAGGDVTMGIADRTKATAGAQNCPTYATGSGLSAATANITFALRPAAGGTSADVAPGVGALTLAGLAPTIGLPKTVAPGVGALVLAGFAPTITSGPTVQPGAGALLLAGFAPTINIPAPVTVTPGVGALVITGFAPTVASAITVSPGTGSLVLTGLAPTLGLPRTVRPGVGALVVTGFAPTLSFVGQVAGWVEFDVYIETSDAGNFEFQWAQNSVSGNPLTVKAGSYIEWTRIS